MRRKHRENIPFVDRIKLRDDPLHRAYTGIPQKEGCPSRYTYLLDRRLESSASRASSIMKNGPREVRNARDGYIYTGSPWKSVCTAVCVCAVGCMNITYTARVGKIRFFSETNDYSDVSACATAEGKKCPLMDLAQGGIVYISIYVGNTENRKSERMKRMDTLRVVSAEIPHYIHI